MSPGGIIVSTDYRFRIDKRCKLIPVTKGPRHHFFGYYDKCPWSANERYLLCLEVGFMDRPPTPHDRATICLIDLKENFEIRRLAYTFAWNWQQGCMLRWLPGKEDRVLMFNDRREGRFVSVFIDLKNEECWMLPTPIYAVSPDGKHALSLNFARLNDTRPGYGYCGLKDPWYDKAAPEEDGIYLVNLRDGSSELIISLGQIARLDPKESFKGAKHWFNHLLFNTKGNRFIFLHRWKRPGETFRTRMFTSGLGGEEICCLIDSGLVSHFDWRDENHILVWALVPGKGTGFFIVEDFTGSAIQVGKGLLVRDGHCSFSPDRRWILTDTYPDAEGYRSLLLFDTRTEQLIHIGKFYSPPELKGEIRCDLHPRWSRDGREVCIDSAHEGTRQMYIVDISRLVAP